MFGLSAKKAVTNPNGSWLPDRTCKELDEREYLYDVKSGALAYKLGCEYVEFSEYD